MEEKKKEKKEICLGGEHLYMMDYKIKAVPGKH